MPRLFTGIEIPEMVAERIAGLRGGLPGARWVDPENYHITLRFLGDIDDSAASEVAHLLERVHRARFALTLNGLDAFGGGKPRAIYVRIATNPELMALQAEQERLIQRAGLPPEQRKFTPHLTIARLRNVKSHAVARYMEARGDFLSGTFEVTRFVLFSSQRSRGGGPYLVEQAYPLDGLPAVREENMKEAR